MTPKEINENAKKYVLQSWSKQKNSNPMPIEKAEGIYFYDYDGNRYTDMTSQLVLEKYFSQMPERMQMKML